MSYRSWQKDTTKCEQVCQTAKDLNSESLPFHLSSGCTDNCLDLIRRHKHVIASDKNGLTCYHVLNHLPVATGTKSVLMCPKQKIEFHFFNLSRNYWQIVETLLSNGVTSRTKQSTLTCPPFHSELQWTCCLLFVAWMVYNIVCRGWEGKGFFPFLIWPFVRNALCPLGQSYLESTVFVSDFGVIN